MTEKQQAEKTKVTLYLSQEGVQMLNEIYSGRLLAGIKVDRSRVAFDALELLHEKEVKCTQKGKEKVTSESFQTVGTAAAENEQERAVKKPVARKKTKKELN